MRKLREDEETDEIRQLTWQSLLTLGLTNEQLKGAIIVSHRVVTVAAILGAYGLLSPLGFDGFAFAGESKEARIEALDTEIFELRIKQCQAFEERSSPIAYTIRLNEKRKKFEELTGRQPRIPTCEELK